MVTTFNTKDLVSFGNYLVSEERTQKIINALNDKHLSGTFEDHAGVSHADIENWKDKQSKIQKVRAKFSCTGLIDGGEEYDSITVEMSAVIEGSPENKAFNKYTPYGNISMGVDKDAEALKLFEVNREYFIDFTKAPVA